MALALGVTWNVDRRLRAFVGMLLAALVLTAVGPVLAQGLARAGGAPEPVIVRSTPGSTTAAEHAVRDLGGQVGREIGIINGFAATVPADGVATLRSLPGITEVTPNGRVRLLDAGSYDPSADANSLYNTTVSTGAQAYWKKGYTGAGVDVALIDSGVSPVEGLSTSGKVLNGPDLSFDSQSPSLQYLDGYGHGTHLAGIIAGRDTAAVQGQYAGDSSDFIGMAPDARIVNVKVADNQGATDVSQVVAGIDWVVQHKNDSGLNIRVLNLSFGTNSTQSYVLDPLAYAAEVAWKSGIVVVASVGNDGSTSTGVADPADDPYVLAVGAADTNGQSSPSNFSVASFSSWGTSRNPDMVAPGVHIASLRDPGSVIDQAHGAGAGVGVRFFRGSGTSQAAAVISGAVALAVQQHPTWTPDEIKQLLVSTSLNLRAPAKASTEGRGVVNLNHALGTGVGSFKQNFPASNGTGSLEAARGSLHVTSPSGMTLTGEQDIFGSAFNSAAMAAAEASGQSWSGGTWNGQSWSGQSWSGQSWSGQSWSGQSWSGQSWSGQSWSGQSWSGQSWSGQSWSGEGWDCGDWS